MTTCDGPYVCDYPEPREHKTGDRWTCPGCGYRYRLTRRKRFHWWRNWSAPDGYWRLSFHDRISL